MRTNLKKDERILLVTRQHWLKMFWPLFGWVAITVLLFLFIEPTTALIIAFITALYPAYLFLEWSYNLWAVTNLRVIDENGFFTRYSKESPLEKINNVEFRTGRKNYGLSLAIVCYLFLRYCLCRNHLHTHVCLFTSCSK